MKKTLQVIALLAALTCAFLFGRFSSKAEFQIKSKPIVLSVQNPEKIDLIEFVGPQKGNVTLCNLKGDRIFNIQGENGGWDVTVTWKDGKKSDPLRIYIYDGTPTHLVIGSRISKAEDISLLKYVWLKIRNENGA